MNPISLRRTAALVTLLMFVVAGCAANLAAPRSVEDPPKGLDPAQLEFDMARAAGSATEVTGANKGAPGLVVHIDPTTGEFRPEPSANEATAAPAPAVKTSIPKFSEISSPTPGGGVMIDLQGQFQTPLVATMDAEGNVTLRHEATAPTEMKLE